MKLDDYMKGMKVDVANCKVRGVCPLGKFCGSKVGEKGAALIPSVLQIKKGDILWTDLHFDPRVLIIRKGIFACLVHADREKEEVPLSLSGAGIAVGFGELYAPATVPSRASGGRESVPMSSTYYLRALLMGRYARYQQASCARSWRRPPPRSSIRFLAACSRTSFALPRP